MHRRLGNVHRRLGNMRRRLGNVRRRLGNMHRGLGNMRRRLGNVRRGLGNIELKIWEGGLLGFGWRRTAVRLYGVRQDHTAWGKGKITTIDRWNRYKARYGNVWLLTASGRPLEPEEKVGILNQGLHPWLPICRPYRAKQELYNCVMK